MTNKAEVSNKPWGHEYLLYENSDIAIWHLIIDPYNETSLHSHPNKKTGLITVKGAAQVHFLNGKYNILPGQKIMIRQGVFHKTSNITSDKLELLEIETPVDKSDLVRLEDSYGREGTPYLENCLGDKVDLPDIANEQCKIGDCVLDMCDIKNIDQQSDFLFAILSGGFYSKHNLCAAGPGDVLDNKILSILKTKFGDPKDTTGLLIRRQNNGLE
jgi:mannose-6-phosphate isomerase-like protein (cupin superfamily)